LRLKPNLKERQQVYREHKEATIKKQINRKDQKNINLPSSQSIIAKLGLHRDEESFSGGNPGYGGIKDTEDIALIPHKLSSIVSSRNITTNPEENTSHSQPKKTEKSLTPVDLKIDSKEQ